MDEALVQLHHMHDAGWHIPSHAFGILMDAFGKRRRVDRALDVFDTMTLWRVPPTQVSYNILISACAVAALPARAVEIFDEMRHTAGLLGDRYTFHALMKAYLKVGDASNVLHYYRLVRKSPFQCNQVSYRYALIASGRGMDIDAVHEVAADMKLAECHPREDTAAALVAAAIRCSDLQSALSFFSSFVSGTKPPKVRSFFSAIRDALKSCEVPSGERNDNSDFKFTSRVVDELERSWRFGR